MANKKISQLTSNGTIDGTEKLLLAKSGVNYYTTAPAIHNYVLSTLGTGTQYYLPRWTNSAGTVIGNSGITDDGSTITLSRATKYTDGNQGLDKIPVSDANGLITWTTVKRNIIYVDGTYGSNTTGALDTPHRPYQTITAAETAASSGDTIVIMPGTYSTTGIGKNGINYHCLNGVKFSGNYVFSDESKGAITISVTGDAEITNGAIFSMNNNSIFSFEFKKVTNAIDEGCFSKGGTLYLKIKESWTLSAYRAFGMTSWNLDGNFYIECPIIACTQGFLVTAGASTNKTLNIYIRTNKLTGASSGNGEMFRVAGASGTTNTINVTMYGDIINNYTGNPAYSPISSNSNDVLNFTLYGNITDVNTGKPALGDTVNNCLGTYKIYGSITAAYHAVGIANSATANIFLYGPVSTSSTSVAAIELAGSAAGAIVEVHDKITNSGNNAASHGINITAASFAGSLRLMSTSRIVTTHAASESVATTGAITIKSFPGSTANKALNASVTQQISTVTVSANVV